MAQDQQQITDALYLGNLDPKVNKRTLYDICIQVSKENASAVLLHNKLCMCEQGEVYCLDAGRTCGFCQYSRIKGRQQTSIWFLPLPVCGESQQ